MSGPRSQFAVAEDLLGVRGCHILGPQRREQKRTIVAFGPMREIVGTLGDSARRQCVCRSPRDRRLKHSAVTASVGGRVPGALRSGLLRKLTRKMSDKFGERHAAED